MFTALHSYLHMHSNKFKLTQSGMSPSHTYSQTFWVHPHSLSYTHTPLNTHTHECTEYRSKSCFKIPDNRWHRTLVFFNCVYVCVWGGACAHVCYGGHFRYNTCMEAKGWLLGVCFLLPPLHRFQRWHSLRPIQQLLYPLRDLSQVLAKM